MLRIGINGQLPMAQDPGPNTTPDNSGEDQGATGAPTNSPDNGGFPPKYSIEKAPQQNAGYMGPENGPFECEHCTFFIQPNACHLVEGDIDPEGCCNLYTPGGNSGVPDLDEDAMGRESDEQSANPDEASEEGTPEEGAQGVS